MHSSAGGFTHWPLRFAVGANDPLRKICVPGRNRAAPATNTPREASQWAPGTVEAIRLLEPFELTKMHLPAASRTP